MRSESRKLLLYLHTEKLQIVKIYFQKFYLREINKLLFMEKEIENIDKMVQALQKASYAVKEFEKAMANLKAIYGSLEEINLIDKIESKLDQWQER